MPDDLKQLLESNLALTEEIHAMVKKIKTYVVMMQVVGFIKVFLIIIPLLFAIWYLPPYIEKIMQSYREMLPQGIKLDDQTVNNINAYLKSLPEAKK